VFRRPHESLEKIHYLLIKKKDFKFILLQARDSKNTRVHERIQTNNLGNIGRSLQTSCPFGGYREKYTREWHARADATTGDGPSRLRRSLAQIGEFARRLYRAQDTERDLFSLRLLNFVIIFSEVTSLRRD